jgi:hypothetical protein
MPNSQYKTKKFIFCYVVYVFLLAILTECFTKIPILRTSLTLYKYICVTQKQTVAIFASYCHLDFLGKFWTKCYFYNKMYCAEIVSLQVRISIVLKFHANHIGGICFLDTLLFCSIFLSFMWEILYRHNTPYSTQFFFTFLPC